MVNYPKDWIRTSIGDLFETITDFVAAGSFKDLSDNVKYYSSPNYAQLIRTTDIKSKFRNNDFVFIDKNAYEYLWRVHFDGTKIIMPNIGNCGEVYIVETDSLPNKRCALGPNAIMLFNTQHDMKLLYYVLQNDDFQESLKDIISPSGQTKFNKTELSKLEIAIPSVLSEQKAIAETLMAFDEHIKNLEELIAKKKMIRDGAVEDLMSGKTRLNGFDGEWETVQFQNVITPKARIGWQGLKKDEYLKKGFAYLISGTDFENGSISLNKISYVKKERYSMDANIQVKEGDVLVTKDGTIGKIARVPELNKKATLNSGVFVFRTNHLLKECFLYWILRSSIFGKFIDDLSAGSTIKHLYQKDLKNFSFTMPVEIKEQKAIADILAAMDEEIEDLRQEKDKIKKIKAGAMDDLLTGKIRLVKEA